MKIWIAIVLAALIVSSASAQTTVLYNPSLTATPTAQGWIPFAGLGGTSTTNATETTLDTTGNVVFAAGYSNYTASQTNPQLVNGAFPVLNPAVGFTLNFNVQIDTATNTNTDRAGFNVILLGSDAKGVELGFWAGDVWAQNVGFTHGEDDAFTTTGAFHQYSLTILNGNYTLSADGTKILSGVTRSYATPAVPYALDNYVFLGDDNVVNSGDEEIKTVSISVPEPTSAMLGIGLASVVLAKRRKRA
jgi:PEP-CTERM motif